MRSKNYALIENGEILMLTDSSHEKEMANNEIPLTSNELALLRACNGDLHLAEMMIRDIKERIAKITPSR